MATPDHTPQGRGYDTSFNFFNHNNDYWTEAGAQPHPFHCTTSAGEKHTPVDLWATDKPSTENGTATVGSVEGYEEYKFEQHVLRIIRAHNSSLPMFLNYDMHVAHEPMQVLLIECTINRMHVAHEPMQVIHYINSTLY
jgi:arylsulfatase I/J